MARRFFGNRAENSSDMFPSGVQQARGNGVFEDSDPTTASQAQDVAQQAQECYSGGSEANHEVVSQVAHSLHSRRTMLPVGTCVGTSSYDLLPPYVEDAPRDAGPQFVSRNFDEMPGRPKAGSQAGCLPTEAPAAAGVRRAIGQTGSADTYFDDDDHLRDGCDKGYFDEDIPENHPNFQTSYGQDASVSAAMPASASSGECVTWSVGSKLHDTGKCTPCKFFRGRRGCKDGARCRLCHYPHPELTYTAIRRILRQKSYEKRLLMESLQSDAPQGALPPGLVHRPLEAPASSSSAAVSAPGPSSAPAAANMAGSS